MAVNDDVGRNLIFGELLFQSRRLRQFSFFWPGFHWFSTIICPGRCWGIKDKT